MTNNEEEEKKFSVSTYTIEEFKKIVNKFNNFNNPSSAEYEDNSHFTYFEEYFDELQVKTIVVERYYIDLDYLEDYSGYYVRCFKRYRRRCTRLHFFSEPFKEKEFTSIFEKKGRLTEEDLKRTYLGFIVIKPLPKTIFGKTCLKTYGDDNGRRKYPVTRNYKVNLYGINLEVESLAYQEQDRVVSACATSALWAVFQYTGLEFHHPILSPLKITNAACNNFPSEQRVLPNDGLEITQMIHGIYNVGLEPCVLADLKLPELKNQIYSFLKGRVPIVLGLSLVNVAKEEENIDAPPIFTNFDNHAVTITGYSIGGSPTPLDESGILLKSSMIDKIYCHDDQIGPFSRITFDGETIKAKLEEVSLETKEYQTLKSSCIDTDHEWADGKSISIPVTMLAPVYHKIRIPYAAILDEIIKLDLSLDTMRLKGKLGIEKKLVWDIYLSKNSQFKTELFAETSLSPDLKNRFLFLNMPRYIWRATALHEDEKIIDVIFDATDLEQGKILHCILVYSEKVYTAICQNLPEQKDDLKNTDMWSSIFDWFYEKCAISVG